MAVGSVWVGLTSNRLIGSSFYVVRECEPIVAGVIGILPFFKFIPSLHEVLDDVKYNWSDQ